MSEKKHLTAEQKAEQIKNVKVIEILTNELDALASLFESKSVWTAYKNSVDNLRKKNELYSKENISKAMTSEQKKQVKLFLAGKATFAPIETKENEVSTSGSNDAEPTTPAKKRHK